MIEYAAGIATGVLMSAGGLVLFAVKVWKDIR